MAAGGPPANLPRLLAPQARRVFFAWTLIGGVNDGEDHARRLALLRGMNAHEPHSA